jgi:iron complex outermembrane recepter protein
MNKQAKKSCCLAAAVSCALSPIPAFAATVLEEIIVVARKREQNIQDVPIAILSHSGEDLENKVIEDLLDLSDVTPGMNVNSASGVSVIILRGIGTRTTQAGQEPSVATYIDGVYNPNGNVNLDSFQDIERVEVLKGPQGTLFGRNATGGLVHIITKDPTQEPEAKVRLGYGRWDTVDAGFYGSTGLSDTLAGNISIHYQDAGDTYMENIFPGNELTPTERHTVRGKLLYTPNDQTTMKLTVSDAQYKSSDSVIRQPVPGLFAQNGLQGTGKFYIVDQDVAENYVEWDKTSVSFDVNYSMDSVDIINVLAWHESDYSQPFDNEGTSGDFLFSDPHIQHDFFSEEFRLVSTGDSDFNWQAGFYYSDYLVEYGDPGLIVTFPGLYILNVAEQTTKGMGVFGEIDWAFTDATSLTVGLRWNQDEIDADFSPTTLTFANGSVVPLFARTKMDDKYNEMTYRVGLNHNVSEDVMIYGTYSRGYKTGGFNLVNLGGAPEPAVEPEFLDAYEAGLKTSGWAGGRVQVNLAAFYYDYQDLQVQTIVDLATKVANAGQATVYGGEFEIKAQTTENLLLSGGLSYIHSEFDEYLGVANLPAPSGFGAVTVPGIDFAGNELVQTPEYSLTVSADYLIPTSLGNFNINLHLFYTDDFYWDDNNRLYEDGYEIVNGTVSWTNPEEDLKISLWGRNLTDTKYSVRRDSAPQPNDNYTPGPPASYGIKAEYSFF